MRVPTSALATLAFSALLLSGCQQLFTTSLGSSLARTSYSIPTNLSTNDASTLLATAKDKQDTKLASALVTSLNTEITNLTNSGGDSATIAQLQQTAAAAAVVASGAGTSVMTNLTAFNDGTLTSTQISAIVSQIQNQTTSDMVTALRYLDPNSTQPATVDATVMNDTDIVLAAAILSANALAPYGITDPTSLSDSPPTTPTLSQYKALPDVQRAQEIINAAPPGSNASTIAGFLSL